jgi:type III secretion protein O
MSMFRELLAIKAFRESKAEGVVRKQRAVLAEATAAREAAEEALERFKLHAIAHEKAMYDALCARVVRLREIEDVQLEVAGLRSGELQHEEFVREAETRRVQQSAQLDADREALRVANRMKEKFVELAQVHADEHLKELERKEDAEMEEAAEVRREREDWGDDSEEGS